MRGLVFLSFGPINLLQFNQQPQPLGPQVQTTLTKASGPAFTERQFLEALKHRKPPAPPPRKLTAAERAQREFERAEVEAKSLPYSIYSDGGLANVKAAHQGVKFARQNRDHEYYMEIVNKAWSEFKSKKK